MGPRGLFLAALLLSVGCCCALGQTPSPTPPQATPPAASDSTASATKPTSPEELPPADKTDVKPPTSPTNAAPDNVVGEPKPIDEWLAPDSGWLEAPMHFVSPVATKLYDWAPDSWHDPKTWEPFEGSVELGLNGQTGNSDTFTSRFAANVRHKTTELVQAVQLTTIQRQADGKRVGDTTLLDGRLDYLMPKTPWNRFAHGLIEYDKFRAFRTRISADAGYGYEFIQTDPKTLIGRFGLSTSREVGGPDDRFKPELLLGVDYKRAFSNNSKITFISTYYPNVTDFNDFRMNSQAACEFLLSKELGLSLKSSAIHRYDSTPFNKKPGDLDYSTMFMWSF
jgi:putative salt-induced outer membrane protein YdiY